MKGRSVLRNPGLLTEAAGKIDALTGEDWTNELSERPQNYLAVPGQPWLDGLCVGKGLIRQFVAMPLGDGYTAEEQLTGEAQHGGLQIVAYPMQASRYEAWRRERLPRRGVQYSMVPSARARRSTRTGTASTRGTDPRVPGASSTSSTACSSFR